MSLRSLARAQIDTAASILDSQQGEENSSQVGQVQHTRELSKHKGLERVLVQVGCKVEDHHSRCICWQLGHHNLEVRYVANTTHRWSFPESLKLAVVHDNRRGLQCPQMLCLASSTDCCQQFHRDSLLCVAHFAVEMALLRDSRALSENRTQNAHVFLACLSMCSCL